VPGLIGREREVAQVAALLRLDDVNLVTITGPGGIGKTRLAFAAAEEVAADFRDGVVAVPLASIAEPGLVLPTLARAAGLRVGESDPLASLERHLRDAAVLFLLDNLEQVAESGPQLLDLLASCPGVKVAATSRTRLRLSREREFPLSPLALPDSVTLFVERAQAVRPDLDTGEASLHAIEELCAGLDGLPLAIELAASRAKVLSPQAMHARLGDRLGLLTGGARDLPVRQQALRSTLDWSHELLGEREQRLFAHLAVFAGGFTLEAAEAVCDADLDTLSTLVDNSLVYAEGERFGTLETVGAYAEEQLAAGGDEDDVRRRHAATFLELVERAAPQLAGADQASWLGVLEAEHENIRASLRSALGAGDVETALRFGAALWGFWLERGYVSEGRQWLGQALAEGDGAHAAVRARALIGAGMLAHYEGDYAAAEALCRESIELHAAGEDRGGTAVALEGLALAVRTRGDFSAAETLFGDALAIFRELGDAEGTARTLDRLGIAVWFGGDDDRASDLVKESLEAFRRLGDRAGIGLALTDLGLVTLGRGDVTTARRLLDDGLALSREVTDRRNVAKALYGLGDVARADGDLAIAAVRYDEGLTAAVEYGFPWLAALFIERLAGLTMTVGSLEQSARLFGAAEALRQAIGAPMPAYFRALYDDDLAALRARLESGKLEAAWEDGRALTAETVLGEAHAVLPAQRATKTFLFSDICRSTNLIEAIGDDAWEHLRRWHDDALRTAFAQHGGEEVDHAGDGFFVAFDSERLAIECAVAIQRRLAEHRRTHGFAPDVRIGLHSTEASRSSGGYAGRGVHESARIGAQAEAGEILVSASTAGAAGGRHPTSQSRQVNLKGIPDPVEVVTIDWR
jgi:predicted ATPase/class 3 adenylate cyclase